GCGKRGGGVAGEAGGRSPVEVIMIGEVAVAAQPAELGVGEGAKLPVVPGGETRLAVAWPAARIPPPVALTVIVRVWFVPTALDAIGRALCREGSDRWLSAW